MRTGRQQPSSEQACSHHSSSRSTRPTTKAFVIEYASPGHLWRVNLGTGARVAVLSDVEFGVGLVLSADLQFAYISEQTTGPDKGRISRVTLATGARQKLATSLTAPCCLSWADAAQTALLIPLRDPANQIVSLSLADLSVTVIASGVPSRPSSVAVVQPGRLLVCSDQVIERVDFSVFQADGPLLMGIGYVPFDKIGATGLATTDPGYFYHVVGAPFGGTLPVMLNFERAAIDGAAYYRVRIDGIPRNDVWTDYKWTGLQYVLQNLGPVSVGGQANFYPVRPLAELFLWMNPSLGMLLNSTTLADGLHSLVVEFTNAMGAVTESSPPVTLMINNRRCIGTLAQPTINSIPADTICGLLHYGLPNNLFPVTMAFTATHPANYATYSFALIKAATQILSTGGNVPGGQVQQTVANLLGTCTTAAFAESLYVATTIQNGWGRQSQYDASAMLAFALSA